MSESVLYTMVKRYPMDSIKAIKNGIKESLQEIILAGLAETDFFKIASFYGGTALRLFHGLNRFSEDLDFSLKIPMNSFQLEKYINPIKQKLFIYGVNAKVEKKEKNIETSMQTAFVKCNASELLQKVLDRNPPFEGTPYNEVLKIKLEIDTNPPDFASFEIDMGLFPNAYEISLYDMPSLFAGKLHALLCRRWGGKVKGRDFYDYIWYLQQGVTVNYKHLEARLKQSGDMEPDHILTHNILEQRLLNRFKTIDFREAILDVSPFVSSPQELSMWNSDFFSTLTKRYLH